MRGLALWVMKLRFSAGSGNFCKSRATDGDVHVASRLISLKLKASCVVHIALSASI